jgi:translocation and assembly module TamB
LEGAGGAKTGGRLDASGSAQWVMKRIPRIDMQVTLDKLRVSNRVDRRLVVSGQVQAQLAGARLKLRGALKANQAAFSLSDELTPRLGDDVVVRGLKTAANSTSANTANNTAIGSSETGTRVIPDVLLDLDLGDNFAVEGSGLKARLQGTLQVRSTPEQPVPRLLGEVRTTSGSYRAYGVNLTLETGLLRFAGPYDNPTLDILAIRPNTTQRVGVQVTGTALAPILRLYAEPELPDTEKLSWLVLGRSAAGPGGEAAILQQAAMSLLGRPGNKMDGGIAGALGLDEVSYRSGGVASDGTVTSAAVSVGKRLSSKLYVVYGQSLTSSVGTVSILYELSKRLTMRAKAGEDNALELVFTQRYD